MGEKVTPLEERIAHFEGLLELMKAATRESHSVLKEIKTERKEIERLLSSKEVRQLVHDRIDEVVKAELEKIGPELKKQSGRIYDRVERQVDLLIDLSMGREFSIANGREDIRPQLAKKLRAWIREVIDSVPGA